MEQRSHEQADSSNRYANGEMPSALVLFVRMTANQDHPDYAEAVRDCRIDSDTRKRSLTPQLWIRVGIQNTNV